MVAERTEAEEDVAANATIGRIVHFVHPDKPERCMAAIVVQNWGDTHGIPSAINAVVFPDGTNDGYADQHTHNLPERLALPKVLDEKPNPWDPTNRVGRDDPQRIPATTHWETSVGPGHAVKLPRTWHWPKACESIPVAEAIVMENGVKIYHIHREGVVDEHNCGACRWLRDARK